VGGGGGERGAEGGGEREGYWGRHGVSSFDGAIERAYVYAKDLIYGSLHIRGRLRSRARRRRMVVMETAAPIDPALLDEDGLLRDFASWNEALAEALARDSGLPALTETHWKVIRAMRANFARSGTAPIMHRVCREAGVERREVNELFGYCLVAWRVAGLPNPGEEARSYLSGM
jgi:tRNA 2-thiouridine synthesizing protein E